MSATLTDMDTGAATAAELNARITDLEAELDVQRQANEKLQHRNDTAKELVEALEEKIKELEQPDEDGIALCARIAELELEKDGWIKALESASAHATAAQARIAELEQQNVQLATEALVPEWACDLEADAARNGRRYADERNAGILADLRRGLDAIADAGGGMLEGLVADALCTARDVRHALFTSEVMAGCADEAREGRRAVLDVRMALCDHLLRVLANTRGFIDWQMAKPV